MVIAHASWQALPVTQWLPLPWCRSLPRLDKRLVQPAGGAYALQPATGCVQCKPRGTQGTRTPRVLTTPPPSHRVPAPAASHNGNGAAAAAAAAAATGAAPDTDSASTSGSAAVDSTGVPFPFLCLLVSGGHNLVVLVQGVGRYVQLGSTVDDALGACARARVSLWWGHNWVVLGPPVCVHATREVAWLACRNPAKEAALHWEMPHPRACHAHAHGARVRAGEAYDKVARLLGLELSPSGGAALEKLARQGDPLRFRWAGAWGGSGVCVWGAVSSSGTCGARAAGACRVQSAVQVSCRGRAQPVQCRAGHRAGQRAGQGAQGRGQARGAGHGAGRLVGGLLVPHALGCPQRPPA